jgi:hypothetical protein
MKRLLILGIFVLVAVGQDVQHAPTVAQCQADQRLWSSEIIDDTYPKPDIDVLQKWTREMRDCRKVDLSTCSIITTRSGISILKSCFAWSTFLTAIIC